MRTSSVLALVRGTLNANVWTSGRKRRNLENHERVVLSLAEPGVVGGRGESGPPEKDWLKGVFAADGGDTVMAESVIIEIPPLLVNSHLSALLFLVNHLLNPLLSLRIGNSLLEEDLGAGG